MIYFDTSYLVRLYYQDAGADAVRTLAATDHVACAAHGQAEMMAAFHRKLREGAIRPVAYAALLGQVRAHSEAGAFHWLAPDEEMFIHANRTALSDAASVGVSACARCHASGYGRRVGVPRDLFE